MSSSSMMVSILRSAKPVFTSLVVQHFQAETLGFQLGGGLVIGALIGGLLFVGHVPDLGFQTFQVRGQTLGVDAYLAGRPPFR